ncbi:MAG: AmmeMemoRadiSam system protein B [Pseudomonadota bacterium]|jgi:AmmeMemoRadiSam system protein B
MIARPAAVAGMFYPDRPDVLVSEIRGYLDNAAAPGPAAAPKALIVPHAGYMYSGPVAAAAYARLQHLRDAISRVLLLGPAHRVPIHGLALPDADAFATPLGMVPIDTAAAERALRLRQVHRSALVHALEHSLEVQLPFLQTVLEDFAIVPFAVGSASPREVSEVIELLWGGPETLIVISSDLSHYHPYREAQRIDGATAQTILGLTPDVDHEQACGATPINGLMLAARRHGLVPELLDLRNSGDTAGDRSRVVGYAAFAFTEGVAHGRH